MKDLTNTDLSTLLGKIKSFLNTTWTDQGTDTELTDMIYSSIKRLDETAGVELDYLLTPAGETGTEDKDLVYYAMCYLAQDLLKNRVFYMREKGLDDFESNYQSELMSLYLYGKGYRYYANKEENVQQQ